jgi:hypothetical protein
MLGGKRSCSSQVRTSREEEAVGGGEREGEGEETGEQEGEDREEEEDGLGAAVGAALACPNTSSLSCAACLLMISSCGAVIPCSSALWHCLSQRVAINPAVYLASLMRCGEEGSTLGWKNSSSCGTRFRRDTRPGGRPFRLK